ncbi:hypothetical protein [Streptomyces sp. NPDC008150]|uniref:hypothetical protein n=1 Tax=Streptomyces sp. NPDC008150 TaxID=3364816 RepID=UPI0036EA1AE6
MTEIDADLWRERMALLDSPLVTAAVVVQCGLGWLAPDNFGLRNEIDRRLASVQWRRGASLTVTRVVLHNLPASPTGSVRSRGTDEAFEEWNFRLSCTTALMHTGVNQASQVHRLIIRGDEGGAPLPDMVELLEDGQWTDNRALLALRTVAAVGRTTPMTGYDVDLNGPFGDTDPSVYL